MNTFDALKKLYDIKETNNENVIDIEGEEENQGSTSKVFECDKYNYTASLENRLKQHKSDKHKEKEVNKGQQREQGSTEMVDLPCDVCKYIAKSGEDYLNHIEIHEASEHRTAYKCHKCDFSSTSSDMLKRHLEEAHRTDNRIQICS